MTRRLITAYLLTWLVLAQQGFTVPGRTSAGNGVNNIAHQNHCGSGVVAGSSSSLALNGGNCSNTSFTPTAGDVVIIYLGLSASQSSAATMTSPDSQGNTWICITDNVNSNKQLVCNSKLSASGNVTENFSWTTSASSVAFSGEFSGAQNSTDGGYNFGTPASSTSWTLPGVTTTNANDAIMGCGNNAGTSLTFSAGSGFSLFGGSSGSAAINGFCEWKNVTATGTYSPTVSLSVSSGGVDVTIAVKST